MEKQILTSDKRIIAFAKLGNYLQNPDTQLIDYINQAHYYNSWFTPDNVANAISAIANMCSDDLLEQWIAPYLNHANLTDQTVGLVLAGNIPMVGFHDILSCLISGYKIQVKLSTDDKFLIPYVLRKLLEFEPLFSDRISYTDRLNGFDLIIATGRNNTARYFEYYFKSVPYIIRKNRNSVAVLTGNESTTELNSLGRDVFDYFGLGCRNVSKIYLPKNYDVRMFYEAIEPYAGVIDHHKYLNNYDYNKSIYLINADVHYDNGFLLLKEDKRIASPLSVCNFEYYSCIDDVAEELNLLSTQIQCIVSKAELKSLFTRVFPLGKSQQPALDDYADGINTLAFLSKNKQ